MSLHSDDDQCLSIIVKFDHSFVLHYIKIWEYSCNCDKNKGGNQVLIVIEQQSPCREEGSSGWMSQKLKQDHCSFPVSNHESTLFLKTITTFVPQSQLLSVS